MRVSVFKASDGTGPMTVEEKDLQWPRQADGYDRIIRLADTTDVDQADTEVSSSVDSGKAK